MIGPSWCKGVVVLCQEQSIWRALEHSDGKIRRRLGRDLGTRHKQSKNIAGSKVHLEHTVIYVDNLNINRYSNKQAPTLKC